MDGSGSVFAVGGTVYQPGGVGRIRIERASVTPDATNNLQVSPGPSVVTLASGATPLLWPPTSAPQVEVISIGGVNAPADPRAGFGSLGPDVALAETATAQVVIETTNVEQASLVQVRRTPRNGQFSTTDATFDSVLNANPLVIRWLADVPVDVGYSAVQVKVIRP